MLTKNEAAAILTKVYVGSPVAWAVMIQLTFNLLARCVPAETPAQIQS
jgi:hypothetical protein